MPLDTTGLEAAPALTQRHRTVRFTPTIRELTMRGRRVLAVTLTGVHGEGLEMLISPRNWAKAAKITERWLLIKDKAGSPFVGSYLASSTTQNSGGYIDLARALCRAKSGDRVFCRNGCALDLRSSNLVVVKSHTLTLPTAALRQSLKINAALNETAALSATHQDTVTNAL